MNIKDALNASQIENAALRAERDAALAELADAKVEVATLKEHLARYAKAEGKA